MTQLNGKVVELGKFLENNADSILEDGGRLCDVIDRKFPNKSIQFRTRLLEIIEKIVLRSLS